MKNLSKNNLKRLAKHNKKQSLKPKFSFESYYPWVKSIVIKKRFTNQVKDPQDFAKKIYYVLNDIIPTVYRNYGAVFRHQYGRQFPHCHIVSSKKYSREIHLLQRICLKFYDNDFQGIVKKGTRSSWWQLGLTQSIRIFGIYNRSDNVFYPLVCDWYHLLLPDRKHNQTDYFREKSYPIQNLGEN